MKKTFLCFFIGSFFGISAFSQKILWEQTYGGKHSEYLLDATPTADYGFILAGASVSDKGGNKIDNGKGGFDFWIWKMDEDGNEEWQKSFGGSKSDFLYSVKNTHDGGFILAGTSDSPCSGDKKYDCRGLEDIWIIKLNAFGNEEWQCNIGGEGKDIVKTIIPLQNGDYVIGGSSSSGMSIKIRNGETDNTGKSQSCIGSLDFWVICIDRTGKIKWQRTIGGAKTDILEDLILTKEGGFLIGGYTNSSSSIFKKHSGYGNGDYWVVKLDMLGEIEWEKTFGGEKDDHLSSIVACKDGGYYIGGSSLSPPGGNKTVSNTNGADYWILKIDEAGNELWQKTYDVGKYDQLSSVVINPDGTILLGGTSYTEVLGSNKKKDTKGVNDYVILKISDEGDELSRKIIGSNGSDVLRKIINTRDDGKLLVGTSNGAISGDRNSSKGNEDFWIVKLLNEDKLSEKKRKRIEAIPNPTRHFTNIIIGFDFNSGTVSVFDLSGRQLQHFEISTRTIPLDISNQPEGVYIVQINTDTGSDSVKIIKSTK